MHRLFINSFINVFSLVVLTIIFTSSISAQDIPPPANAQGKTLLQVVKSNDDISEFVQLLEDSGYSQILEEEGPYTVLAPSNDALKKVATELKENPQALVQGQLFQGNVPKELVEPELNVTVEETDDNAANGTIHVVDKINDRL